VNALNLLKSELRGTEAYCSVEFAEPLAPESWVFPADNQLLQRITMKRSAGVVASDSSVHIHAHHPVRIIFKVSRNFIVGFRLMAELTL
jgi:hypothetical protein